MLNWCAMRRPPGRFSRSGASNKQRSSGLRLTLIARVPCFAGPGLAGLGWALGWLGRCRWALQGRFAASTPPSPPPAPSLSLPPLHITFPFALAFLCPLPHAPPLQASARPGVARACSLRCTQPPRGSGREPGGPSGRIITSLTISRVTRVSCNRVVNNANVTVITHGSLRK